ncbi:hypothetical protein QN277_028798 [Acacia crassicarpa]|uniref:Transposase-associated domain-containing protein n=1 Tax=Acacia crassicarpa TaxID=499986 RepID=A0AAE1MFJ7_9FABA|nr:hypothetical protein QN277_028798 [Acacia crassicarpa]
MDKSWLNIKDRGNVAYIRGVDNFLAWAFSQHGVTSKIRCPCKKCRNVSFKVKTDVRADLLIKGFWDSYKVWDLHGEVRRYRSGCETSRRVVENDTCEDENVVRMVCDAYGVPCSDDINSGLNETEEPNAHAKWFFDLLKDVAVDNVRTQLLEKFDKKFQEERAEIEAERAEERARMEAERAEERARMEAERAEERTEFDQKMKQMEQRILAVLMQQGQIAAPTSSTLGLPIPQAYQSS